MGTSLAQKSRLPSSESTRSVDSCRAPCVTSVWLWRRLTRSCSSLRLLYCFLSVWAYSESTYRAPLRVFTLWVSQQVSSSKPLLVQLSMLSSSCLWRSEWFILSCLSIKVLKISSSDSPYDTGDRVFIDGMFCWCILSWSYLKTLLSDANFVVKKMGLFAVRKFQYCLPTYTIISWNFFPRLFSPALTVRRHITSTASSFRNSCECLFI